MPGPGRGTRSRTISPVTESTESGDGEGETGEKARSGRRRIAAAAAGVLVALVLAELGLRGYHAARGTYDLTPVAERARTSSIWTRSDDPELAYVHRPGYDGPGDADTEAGGLLHAADVPRGKPEGVTRIGLVGDSVGAGLLLRREDRFATRIESALRSVGREVEVLNFCVNGYSTVQEARVVETRLADYDVDVVLLQYCMNDPLVTHTPMAWFVDPEPPTSYVWSAVADGLRAALGEPPALEYVPANTLETPGFWQRHYAPDSESWASVLHGLDRIAAWSRENDVPVLVAIVPLVVPADPTGATSEGFRRQVAGACADRDLEHVDVQWIFTAHAGADLQQTPGDVYHPSAEGHALIARALTGPLLQILDDRP